VQATAIGQEVGVEELVGLCCHELVASSGQATDDRVEHTRLGDDGEAGPRTLSGVSKGSTDLEPNLAIMVFSRGASRGWGGAIRMTVLGSHLSRHSNAHDAIVRPIDGRVWVGQIVLDHVHSLLGHVRHRRSVPRGLGPVLVVHDSKHTSGDGILGRHPRAPVTPVFPALADEVRERAPDEALVAPVLLSVVQDRHVLLTRCTTVCLNHHHGSPTVSRGCAKRIAACPTKVLQPRNSRKVSRRSGKTHLGAVVEHLS
jgi:hypothetical protein